MSMVTLNRQARALKGALDYRQDRHTKDDETSGWRLSIALSAEVGTPVGAVADEVGRRLGWAVHDEDILHRIADQLGISVTSLEAFDEHRRGWLLECLESFSSRPSVGEYVYVRLLLRELRGFAAEGNCILVGRGSALALPSRSTLRVRVIGSREDRATALSQRLGVHHERALLMLDELEQERAAFIRDHFNRDPREIDNYDLVVNTSHLQPGECAALIIEAVHQRAAQSMQIRA